MTRARPALCVSLVATALALAACWGGDVQLEPDVSKAEQALACPMGPHANMCKAQTVGTPVHQLEQLLRLEDVAEYLGESNDVVAKLDEACTAMARELDVSDAPPGGNPVDHAAAACRAVEPLIGSNGPFLRDTGPDIPASLCTTASRPSCNGLVILPARVDCDEAPISFRECSADVPCSPKTREVLMAHLPALIAARPRLDSITTLVDPTTFPTQGDSVPPACVEPVSQAIGTATREIWAARDIIEGILGAVDGLNGPLR
jgi:hypothetical protein